MTAEPWILLVEDNPGDVLLVRKALEAWPTPVRLTVAYDGERAIESLRKRCRGRMTLPDLVLLDLHLPRTDGRDFLQQVKTDPSLLHVPVIVLTSSPNEADVLATYRLHANCYLEKPVEFGRLDGLMRSLLEFWLGAARLPELR